MKTVNSNVSTLSLRLYAEEVGVDLWFPQTLEEYFSSILEEKIGIIHLFREIIVQIKSVPNYSAEDLDETHDDELDESKTIFEMNSEDIVYPNEWVPARTYFVAGIHDYGYWSLLGDGSGYKRISKFEPKFWDCNPVVKTISFRPCGVSSRTSEIDREV